MILSFKDSVLGMWDWIMQYTGKSPAILGLSIVSVIYLLAASGEFRKKLLAPIIVLVLLVFNPLLYSLVYGNNNLPFVSNFGLRYGRFLWMLPQGLVIAGASALLIKRVSRYPWARWAVLLAAAGLIMLCGQRLFTKENEYYPAQSAYKLSPSVQEVCEAILSDDPRPLCMFDSPMCAQVREYSGDIRQLWGRNGVWNIVNDDRSVEVYNLLNGKPRDWETAFAYAREKGVTHISYSRRRDEDEEDIVALAARHGYEPFANVSTRILFHRAEG